VGISSDGKSCGLLSTKSRVNGVRMRKRSDGLFGRGELDRIFGMARLRVVV
jgi:hypothetical protein